MLHNFTIILIHKSKISLLKLPRYIARDNAKDLFIYTSLPISSYPKNITIFTATKFLMYLLPETLYLIPVKFSIFHSNIRTPTVTIFLPLSLYLHDFAFFTVQCLYIRRINRSGNHKSPVSVEMRNESGYFLYSPLAPDVAL